ncbi:uncharacterized protein LOC142356312, partial [Convolutriloba macropyga]|uniref:uncharacterized protein LOC142356312 n=1 Tax=Convolutriloba macropyga TaxID=536237 RepID=UPI003F51E888
MDSEKFQKGQGDYPVVYYGLDKGGVNVKMYGLNGQSHRQGLNPALPVRHPCDCPPAPCCQPQSQLPSQPTPPPPPQSQSNKPDTPPRMGERFFASQDVNDLWHYITHFATPPSTCRSGPAMTVCSSTPPGTNCGTARSAEAGQQKECCGDTNTCLPHGVVQERTQLVFDQIQNVKSIIQNIRQSVKDQAMGGARPCSGSPCYNPSSIGGPGGTTITCYDQTGIYAIDTGRDSFTTIGDSDRNNCTYPCGTLPCDCKSNCWRPQTVYCPPQNPGIYPAQTSFCYPSSYQ